MKIYEHKHIFTRTEHHEIRHDDVLDSDGNVIKPAWYEPLDVEVPVMGIMPRDATPEEVAEMERMKSDMPEPEMTTEERLQQVEAVSDMAYVNSELALAMLEGLEG